jgi:hypothetical protein
METAQEVVLEEVERAAKLSSQWPKLHGCSAASKWSGRWLRVTQEQFAAMPLRPEDVQVDEFCRIEHKHCECGGTMTAVTEIYDAELE